MKDLLYFDLIALPTILCAFLIFIVGYIQLWKLRKTNQPEFIGIFWIWLIGLIALLFGIFGHIFTLRSAFEAIENAGDISASFVAESVGDCYIHTLRGLLIFITALILWGTLKSVKQKRLKQLLVSNQNNN